MASTPNRLQEALTILWISIAKLSHIISRAVVTKLVASFLGPAGITVLSMTQNLSDIGKLALSLGLAESAIPSLAKKSPEASWAQFLTLTKLYLFLAALTVFVAFFYSETLSILFFGSSESETEVRLISISIFFWMLGERNLMLLRASRKITDFNYSQITASFLMIIVAGLLAGSLNAQVVGALVALSGSCLYFSSLFYVVKHKAGLGCVVSEPPKLFSFNDFMEAVFSSQYLSGIRNVVLPGLAILVIMLGGLITEYLIRLYILVEGGEVVAGNYNAGLIMVSGYFGLFLSALLADYYPRISAANEVDAQMLINSQVAVGLSMAAPAIHFFLILLPLITSLLFSDEFIASVEYSAVAVLSVLIVLVSNTLDIFLLSRRKFAVLVPFSLGYRTLQYLISISLYQAYGLSGVGIAMIATASFHLVFFYYYMRHVQNFTFHKNTVCKIIEVFGCAVLSFWMLYIASFDHSLFFAVGILFFVSFRTCLFFGANSKR